MKKVVKYENGIIYVLADSAFNRRVINSIYYPKISEVAKKCIKENIDIIRDLGFEVEEFGTNTFRVLSHPDWLREGFEEESI